MSSVGAPVPDWQPPPLPARAALAGAHVRLEPLDPDRHAGALFEALRREALWTYLPYGPFERVEDHARVLASQAAQPDPMFFTLCAGDAWRPLGVASYLRIAPAQGSIEVGHICFGPELQGTVAATEAMWLMMAQAFGMGYRRYEWKCDALNLPSRQAAQRLGFSYEGLFRQAAVVKGRNRDTAWFSVIDSEWPALDAAFRTWLAPDNFDASGRQVRCLSDLTRPLLATPDPVAGARS